MRLAAKVQRTVLIDVLEQLSTSCRMYGGCSWEGRRFLQMSRISLRVPGLLQAVWQDR